MVLDLRQSFCELLWTCFFLCKYKNYVLVPEYVIFKCLWVCLFFISWFLFVCVCSPSCPICPSLDSLLCSPPSHVHMHACLVRLFCLCGCLHSPSSVFSCSHVFVLSQFLFPCSFICILSLCLSSLSSPYPSVPVSSLCIWISPFVLHPVLFCFFILACLVCEMFSFPSPVVSVKFCSAVFSWYVHSALIASSIY